MRVNNINHCHFDIRKSSCSFRHIEQMIFVFLKGRLNEIDFFSRSVCHLADDMPDWKRVKMSEESCLTCQMMNIEVNRHRKRTIVKQKDFNEKVDVREKPNVYRYEETVDIQQELETMHFFSQVNFNIEHVDKQSSLQSYWLMIEITFQQIHANWNILF